ncbi:uncharacterized protein LOC143298567 [Babylonia areolata]|uniref:uncharacterized protein LOC143298567 n=1 Tax=Babylonia areolata TaxID=304850 RepID=UPI003FD325C8
MISNETSRSNFRKLIDTVYFKCAECFEKREEEILVLPCIHVVCKTCVRSALQRARGATTLPKKLQLTKYHDPRRFECPVCSWPQYVPYDADDQIAFPSKLPLHADLLSAGDCPPKVFPLDDLPGIGKQPSPLTCLDVTTRGSSSSYIYETDLGSYGSRFQQGQMKSVTGLAVDEHDPAHPMIVVGESESNVLLSFHLSGKLEQARKAKVRIRDVCIAEKGTIVAAVAEENYCLAKWDSALTVSGVRHENLFRDIYGHVAQINSEPFGVARDGRGRFSVTMLAKDRVCRWDERRCGDHISWFGDTGRSGTLLMGPYHVAKLSNGFSVVSSTNDHRVKVVDDDSNTLVTEMGGLGCGLLDLCFPRGVCVDKDDNVYIADTGNFRVVTYTKNGDFRSCVVTETWDYGSDVKPTNVAVMGDGRVMVAMQGHAYCKVHVYRPRRDRADSEEGGCRCNWTKCWSRSGCAFHEDYESLD